MNSMDEAVERWADIPGWPGFRASTEGRLTGKRGKIMTPAKSYNGYLRACFGISKNVLVHRIVASTFIGQIPERFQVNHKNGVRDDNRLVNLEIVTCSENHLHSFRELGRKSSNPNPCRGETNSKAKLTNEKVLEIRRLYAAGLNQSQLAAQFGVIQAQISNIVRRVQWKHI